MTFDQLVDRTLLRLNLSSEAARERVGERINEGYKAVTSSIGLITSRRLDQTIVIDPTDPDYDDLPELTITGIEKVNRINLIPDGLRPKTLEQVLYDDIANQQIISQTPSKWANKRMGSQSVTIIFDAFPETDTFTITVDGYELADELADDAEPAFAESFHDVLIEYAMAEELRKMEKPDLAEMALGKYERRLSDLRMFIAKAAYMDIYEGKHKQNRFFPFQNRWDRY